MNAVEHSVALVIPCYNPSPGWETLAQERFAALAAQRPQFEWRLVVVDDGSVMGMEDEVRRAMMNRLPASSRWLARASNGGKGRALREGVAAAEADFYVFTDADFPYDDASMLAVVDRLAENRAAVVAGVRERSRRAGAPLSRRVLSWTLRGFNRWVLRSTIEDSQCGLKGFARSAREVFLAVRTDGYLFDLEFLRRARAKKISIEAVPVTWRGPTASSRVSLRVLGREFRSLCRILSEAAR